MGSLIQKHAEETLHKKPRALIDGVNERIVKGVMKEAVAPPVEDTLSKVEAAIAQAKAQRQKVRKVWRCTICGAPGIQLYSAGNVARFGHFCVAIDDDEAVDPATEEPLTGDEAEVMRVVLADGQR